MTQSPSWIQIIISSLILPAVVAFLVSLYEARRRDNRDRTDWFDNVISAASGIDRAWYKSSELTDKKQRNTTETVDEYVGRLTERKNSPLSPSELTEAIELLDRKWIDAKNSLPVNQNSLYETLGTSIRRKARQVEFIAEQKRPKSLRSRLVQGRPQPIDRIKRFQELGYDRGRVRRFSYDNVIVLKEYYSKGEINQIEKGEKTIRVTSPFDSRFCVRDSDSGDSRFISIDGFGRRSSGQLRFSFRVFPIEEEQLIQELKKAQDWELEDIETTQEILSRGLETSP